MTRQSALHLPPGAGIVIAFILLVIAARIAYSGFFAGQNLENLIRQNVSLGLVGVGVAFVIISGNFDLSVGPIFGLSGVVFASLSAHHGIGLAAVLAILCSVAAGVVNAFVVTRLKVNSFIATLATGTMIGGVSLKIAEGGTVIGANPHFSSLGLAHLAGIPIDIIVLVVAFIAGGIILARTTFGQHVYAVGGNLEASRLAGIPVDRTQSATFLISGLLTGIAGVIAASKVGVGQADAGTTLTLDAIAVVVVGGVSILGGQGAMWRVAIGLLILATLNNLFASLAWSTQLQEVTKGVVIIIALGADRAHRSRAALTRAWQALTSRGRRSRALQTPGSG